MADSTAAALQGIDSPRQLPNAIRDRLEQTIIANVVAADPENFPVILDRSKRMPQQMRARLEGSLLQQDSDVVTLMDGIDAPRPVPAAVVARIERSLLRRNSLRRVYQMSGAAAVAMLIVAGSVFLAANRTSIPAHPGSNQAIPTITPGDGTQITPSPRRSPVVLGVHETRTPPQRDANESAPSSGAQASAPHTFDSSFADAPFTSSNQFKRASRESLPDSTNQGLVGSVTTLVSDLLQKLGLPPHIGTLLPAAPPSAPTPVVVAPAPDRRTAKHAIIRHRRRHRSSHATSASDRATSGPSTSTSDSSTSGIRVHLVPIIGSGNPRSQTLSLSAAGISVSV